MSHLIILLEPGSSHHTSPLRHLQGGAQWPQSGSQGFRSQTLVHISPAPVATQCSQPIHAGGLDSPDTSLCPLLHSSTTPHSSPHLVLIHAALCLGHIPSFSFWLRDLLVQGFLYLLQVLEQLEAARSSLAQGHCSVENW